MAVSASSRVSDKKKRTSSSAIKDQTPAQLGFRMPAEWEPQVAVWLSWPHNKKTWPGYFRPIPSKFAEIVATISRFEEVRINIAKPLQARAHSLIAKAKADLDRVTFYNHETNDSWCRDHGPIFVKNDKTGEVALTDWEYNAWGGKYPPFDKDNKIPPLIGKALGLRRFEKSMVLEGGSIDVNGAGLLLTTEACLLNKNRNPQLTKEQIEQALRDYLGVETILWLGDGIIGDDTDGHIDDLSRFYKTDGIVTVVESNKRDKNYKILQENLERLHALRTPAGKKLSIAELPMPKPTFCDGQQMPASYANFLVINGAVLMPAFRQPKRDAEAAEVLQSCFPGREIVPIDCLELVWGLGTLHCISQQQPA
ncbi:MAG TPA: agmatine deiminase family protein [Opitutaceae bacterium]|nr:agmatine deiminase family protein [Opitutaceae bacterium]